MDGKLTPEAIYLLYHQNVRYDYFMKEDSWICRSPEQVLEDGLANCHDASNFFHEYLSKCLDVKQFYHVLMKSTSVSTPKIDGWHSINCFYMDEAFWIIEGTWYMLGGIHGPFATFSEAMDWVLRTYSWVYSNDGAPDDLMYELFYAEEVFTGMKSEDVDGLIKRNSEGKPLKVIPFENPTFSFLNSIEKQKTIIVGIDRRPGLCKCNMNTLKKCFNSIGLPFITFEVPIDEPAYNVYNKDIEIPFITKYPVHMSVMMKEQKGYECSFQISLNHNPQSSMKTTRVETVQELFMRKFKPCLGKRFIFICNEHSIIVGHKLKKALKDAVIVGINSFEMLYDEITHGNNTSTDEFREGIIKEGKSLGKALLMKSKMRKIASEADLIINVLEGNEQFEYKDGKKVFSNELGNQINHITIPSNVSMINADIEDAKVLNLFKDAHAYAPVAKQIVDLVKPYLI